MGLARIFRQAPGFARGAAVALMLFSAIASGVAAKKTPPSRPIDLNTATLKELEQLPGVGPTTAKAIIEFRTRSGRFRRVNDLLVIRGISETKLQKMRPYVTVGFPPPAAKKAASPGAPKPAPATPPDSQPRPTVPPTATPPS
jgi:competence ComEA-like helix-hairpin-helix protein